MADYYDEEVLRNYGNETVKLSEEYKMARVAYGNALVQMKLALIQGYKNKLIKDTISEDKAYLQLIAQDEDLESVFTDMILKEQTYKGLEKIIDARKQQTSQEQSFIKNRIQSGA